MVATGARVVAPIVAAIRVRRGARAAGRDPALGGEDHEDEARHARGDRRHHPLVVVCCGGAVNKMGSAASEACGDFVGSGKGAPWATARLGEAVVR